MDHGDGRTGSAPGGVSDLKISVPGVQRAYVFVPRPDITVEELCASLPMLFLAPVALVMQRRQPLAETIYRSLPEGAQRHFDEVEYPRIIQPSSPNGRAQG